MERNRCIKPFYLVDHLVGYDLKSDEAAIKVRESYKKFLEYQNFLADPKKYSNVVLRKGWSNYARLRSERIIFLDANQKKTKSPNKLFEIYYCPVLQESKERKI